MPHRGEMNKSPPDTDLPLILQDGGWASNAPQRRRLSDNLRFQRETSVRNASHASSDDFPAMACG
jgi:hypothetical protein